MAGWRFRQVVRELDRGEITRHTAMHAVTVAMLVALVGLGMAIYLISVGSAGKSGGGSGKEVSYARTK